MSRIDGWKSIAAYLGRTVRTAQRWERDFDLPVRRLGTDRFESVFAFTEELDAWIASAPGTRASVGAEDGEPSAAAPPPVSRSRIRGRRWLAASLVVVALVGTAAWWTARQAGGRRCSAPPSTWRVDGGRIIAADTNGSPCWTYMLPPSAVPDAGARVSVQGAAVDLDGDEEREFWVVPPPGRDGLRAAYLFNDDGALRWVYRPAGSATFGGQAVSGPWSVTGVFVTEDPSEASRLAIWVAGGTRVSSHSLLTRVDIRTGLVSGAPFWHAGPIRTLTMFRCPAGARLAVGAGSTESRAPIMFILDAVSPGGASASADASHRCETCGGGVPLATVLFPRPERFTTVRGTGVVRAITLGHGPDAFTVDVDYLAAEGLPSATAVFRLDRHLAVTQVQAAADYGRAYEVLVRDRVLPDSGPLPADGATDLPAIHVDPGGRDAAVAPARPSGAR